MKKNYGPFQLYVDHYHLKWRDNLEYIRQPGALRNALRSVFRHLDMQRPTDLAAWPMPRLQYEYIERSAELYLRTRYTGEWQTVHQQIKLEQEAKAINKNKSAIPKPRPANEQPELF